MNHGTIDHGTIGRTVDHGTRAAADQGVNGHGPGHDGPHDGGPGHHGSAGPGSAGNGAESTGPAGREDAGQGADGPGATEIVHRRLRAAAADLAARAGELDRHRAEVFGTGAVELTRSTSFTTERPAYAQDLAHVGGLLLAGLRPAPGAAAEGVTDTFALYRPGPLGPEPVPPGALPGLLDDPRLHRDVADLHRYYRHARLTRLRRTGPHLLAVFRTGDRDGDTRTLRWRVTGAGAPAYLDAEGHRDDAAPGDVTWVPAGREHHTGGPAPGVALPGGVRVAVGGGHLTLTATPDVPPTVLPAVLPAAPAGAAPGPAGDPSGIREPVQDPRQALADLAVAYAECGPLTLVRVRPYHEEHDRFYVAHPPSGRVTRLDALGAGVMPLPRHQGVVFPGGYVLASGDIRTWDLDTTGLAPDAALTSPAGDAVLHVFRDRADGRTLLLPYSSLTEEAGPPVTGRGHAVLDDGTIVVLLDPPDGAAGTGHTVQLWTSPFTAQAPPTTTDAGPLARVGNAALVAGVADCLSLARAAARPVPAADWYTATAAGAARVADTHHWLTDDDLGAPATAVEAIRAAAAQALEEIRRVGELRRDAAAALDEAVARTATLRRRARGETPVSAEAWIDRLTALRRAQGRLESLRSLRYVDTARLDAAAGETADALRRTAEGAAAFLGTDGAFARHHADLARTAAEAAETTTLADADALAARLDDEAARLHTTTDVLGALEMSTAARTAVLARLGEVLAAVNRARAAVAARRRVLRHAEEQAFFEAEFALLGGQAEAALATADTPEECDARLGPLLARAEDLRARVEDDGYVRRVDAWHAETTTLFAARRQEHLDERAARAERLAASADRVLTTVTARSRDLRGDDDLHAYFAADPLVVKARETAGALRALGEAARADEITTRLTAIADEARRALRDHADLVTADGTLRLGRHRFTVTARPPELTLVAADGALCFAVTGTGYREPVPAHPDVDAHPGFHDQPLASESPEVYRAEHLAAVVLDEIDRGGIATGRPRGAGAADGTAEPALAAGEFAPADRPVDPYEPSVTPQETGEPGEFAPDAGTPGPPGGLLSAVRAAAAERPGEGYAAGVHDHDAAVIAAAVLRLRSAAAPLRFRPSVRAAAQTFWDHGATGDERNRWTVLARSLARAGQAYGPGAADPATTRELADAVRGFHAATGLAGEHARDAFWHDAGAYLAAELALRPGTLAVASGTRELAGAFRADPAAEALADDLAALDGDLTARHRLAAAWLRGFTAGRPDLDPAVLPETAALLLAPPGTDRHVVPAPVTATVAGLRGTHPRVSPDGRLAVRLDEFLDRTGRFRTERVPAHHTYTRARAALLAAERERLDLDAHRPRVMPAFVRNRLVDQVYLPLLGDNLARQLGAAGPAARTDRQGLLLLLSPPGYGKTTLIEYVAARLGLLLVKVDGPALGRRTTSLDPGAAPDAAARREVEKVNLALALGSGVILHIDDIQHVSPEFLEKFIPLCDAQRRADGVWRGRARTYDLRGRRFAVTMAGNPYTSTGARFRIPDMLANRADVHDLGDVLAGRDDLFALSHVENALTANPVLAPLAHRGHADLDVLLGMAAGDPDARAAGLRHAYGPARLDEIVAVLRHLVRVRDTVLAVNRAYIDSASRSAADRDGPAFRLQGSYRDTCRLAARLTAAHTAGEVDLLVEDHYRAEARTLGQDAEANLRMLAALRRGPVATAARGRDGG